MIAGIANRSENPEPSTVTSDFLKWDFLCLQLFGEGEKLQRPVDVDLSNT